MEKRKLLVLESKAFPASELKELMSNIDFALTAVCANARKTLYLLQKLTPDLIIVALASEEDLQNILIVEHIKKTYSIPIIYLSKTSNDYLFFRAKKTNPINYLLFPISVQEFEIAIELAFYNFA